MKYVGKFDTPIFGAEIRENERFISASIGRNTIVEFEVFINNKFKARFKELQHAVNSVCRSYNIKEIPMTEWDLWWDFIID